MKITYHAAPGDDREVDYLGLHLKDGEAVEIPENLDAKKLAKARENPCFEVSGGAAPVETAETHDDLVAQAEELGIAVDKRWGDARLRSEIDAALKK